MTTTDLLARVVVDGKEITCFVNGQTDGATEVELTTWGAAQSIGQLGRALQVVQIQASDGSGLTTVVVRDGADNLVAIWGGSERTATSGGGWNFSRTDLNIALSNGTRILTTTAD